MQSEQHLRPVPPPSAESTDDTGSESGQGGGEAGSGATKVRPPRPSKALPTDRMKLEVQKKALSAIAILSEYGKRGISGADMAPRLEVAATTAGLNNSFFAESKLIERTGKGRFKSTDAANEFARRFSFNQEEAGLCLKDPLSKTWYFKTVSQQIGGFGPTPKEKLIELLAYDAETTKDYRVHLGTLLSWLEYAGLIKLEDGKYQLTTSAPEAREGSAEAKEEPKAPEKETPPATPEGTTSAPEGGGQSQSANAILGFNFDFTLTGDQLAKLSPEQITALFKAVGDVMAIKATVSDD